MKRGEKLTEVVSVKFKSKGKVYYFDPNGLTIEKGQEIIVETAKGLEFSECVWGNHSVNDDSVIPPLRRGQKNSRRKQGKGSRGF